MAYSLGIDCSTQSISAIVIDLDNDNDLELTIDDLKWNKNI